MAAKDYNVQVTDENCSVLESGNETFYGGRRTYSTGTGRISER